jgi:fluoroacetyl-CoA thioesterase
MKDTLQPGMEHTFTFTITDAQTVPALYPESNELKAMPNVFATGYMIGLIEWTCIQALIPHLDWPDEQTVGIHVNVNHLAATPPGFDVTVRVKLVGVDGRRLAFEVEAHDGIDLITRGKHERFIIQKGKFDRKIQEKTQKKTS